MVWWMWPFSWCPTSWCGRQVLVGVVDLAPPVYVVGLAKSVGVVSSWRFSLVNDRSLAARDRLFRMDTLDEAPFR